MKKSKKIVIDARMINASGIGRYLQEIIPSVLQLDEIVVVLIGNSVRLHQLYGRYGVKIIDFDLSVYSIKAQLILPFIIGRCDLFWAPHFSSTFLPVMGKRLVTIHDTFHLANRNVFSRIEYLYAVFLYKMSVLYAKNIITVSNFSKEEIQKFLGGGKKTTVIYNGVDTGLFSKLSLSESFLKYGKYILCVGNVKPHKNLGIVLEAFRILKTKDSSFSLVIVGKKDGFIKDDSLVIKSFVQEKGIFFTGYVEDDELVSLYQNANVFIFPSLYEGFGLPPLEALAAGSRVIVSKNKPMPEICQNMVEYFNPNDSKELVNLILKEKEPESSIDILKFLNMYSWEDCIKNHMLIINILING